jgi:large subunit ribosomal protein L3
MLGLIGKKVGMTQVFDDRGVLTPVTVIKIEDNVVVSERTVEKSGYSACVIGAVDAKKNRVTKPYAGQFKDVCEPKKMLVEMRDYEKEVNIGDVLGLDIFQDIAFVDIEGTSKGKGYQGVMKRHNFKGGRATHGSKFHRGLGGTGMAATPSRVFKGTKMPGRMGGEKTTVQNLRVVKIDAEKKVLMVKGAVPGPRQSVVIVKKSKKK